MNDLDPVWKALADPTRREILDLLRAGPRTTTEIVAHFPQLTRFGVMKHIDVLRQASLINTREEGRRRIHAECGPYSGRFTNVGLLVLRSGQPPPPFLKRRLESDPESE